MSSICGIDPEKIRFIVERILALKDELNSLRTQVEEERRQAQKDESIRQLLEAELKELRGSLVSRVESEENRSLDMARRVVEMIPGKLAAILRRNGKASLPGLGSFVLRYGPEGAAVDFVPDKDFSVKFQG